jgi:hypothetical protein
MQQIQVCVELLYTLFHWILTWMYKEGHTDITSGSWLRNLEKFIGLAETPELVMTEADELRSILVLK